MTVPKGLGPRGRALYSSIEKGLPKGWELDDRESALLTLAARQADDVARLETAIRDEGTVVRGSQGQPVVNGALAEARQGRLAIGRLLAALALPDEEERPQTEASKRAARAARARWELADRRKARARG